jgi:hypothetical protein
MAKVVKIIGRIPVEYLGGSTVKYTWPCGHTKTEVLMIGPKTGLGAKKMQRPMSPDLLAKFVPYWNRAGGVSMPACPKCERLKKAEQRIK